MTEAYYVNHEWCARCGTTCRFPDFHNRKEDMILPGDSETFPFEEEDYE